MGNNNNNGSKWKRNNSLKLNMRELGHGAPARTTLRNRAGLSPLSSTMNVYSRNYRPDPKNPERNKLQIFFPINRAPNFMERKPTMKAMLNRVKKPSATRRRNNSRRPGTPVPRNLEKLLPKGLLANSPNSPNPFEGIFSPKTGRRHQTTRKR